MVVLRRAQIEILSQAPKGQFEGRLVDHLRRFFPAICESLGPESLTALVRAGVQRAEIYGFTAEREVSKYLNLICTFGPDFDTDPALPWAAEILALGGRPSKKMDKLYAVALERAKDGKGLQGRARRESAS